MRSGGSPAGAGGRPAGAPYSLADRPLRVDTVLGPDVLLVTGYTGVEGVSTPFSFRVDLVSTDHSVKAADLLRTPITLTVELADGSERPINGLISRFSRGERTVDFTRYHAEVVPWLWFLSLSRDCKIFQNMNVLEILEAVFKAQGYSDFEIKCRPGDYPKREFCVQYRETHLNFVSRLMEEEGIFYFFQHTDSKHILTLADSNDAFAACPGADRVRLLPKQAILPDREDVLTSLVQEHSVYVGKVSLKDYDHLQPSLSLASMLSGDGKEEIYDYPGMYTTQDAGDRYARLQLEAEEAMRNVVRGVGTCRALRSGYRFTVEDALKGPLEEDTFVLLRVQHTARAGEYHTGQQSGPFEYRTEFLAIPHSVTYRPPRQAKKPVVRGSQTAVVVGKAGEEIWTDKHGRVKLHFHWDRDSKKDEKSSCWVRVASPWAGKGWGMINIPRIGQEVIVDFLEGDPDRPIITGRVYNAEQVPPYDLPANQTQSGIKSRSSKGGGTENFNEIRMEDKKGEELLYIHAEKDKEVVVENDRTESVGNDETIEIGNDRSESVGANETIKVGKNRSESVGGDESITISGNRSESVGKDETVSVSGNRAATVNKDESLEVGGNRVKTIKKDEKVSVGKARSTQVGDDDELKVGKKLVITAGDQVLIKAGSASILLKKDGTIQIKGKDITLDGSGKIGLKASSDVTLKGSQVKQN